MFKTIQTFQYKIDKKHDHKECIQGHSTISYKDYTQNQFHPKHLFLHFYVVNQFEALAKRKL